MTCCDQKRKAGRISAVRPSHGPSAGRLARRRLSKVTHGAIGPLKWSQRWHSSVAIGFPDAHAQGLADTQAHAHGDTDDEGADQDLDYYPVSLAHSGEALARALVDLGSLGLLLPMRLTRPDLAVWATLEIAAARALHAARVVGRGQGAG